jgi:cysteine desulfurase / selenocysteine lyase
MNKSDFPILTRKVNGKPLVYLDNAATSQKPQQVIDAIADYYLKSNANVHRGIHTLSEEATELLETTRKKVADFINAPSYEEIIFTSGTTEGLNFLADALTAKFVGPGDTILVTELEHHSNFVPWQKAAERIGAKFDIVEVSKEGQINLQDFASKLNDKVKILAFSHASNVLGTILPVKEICKLAKKFGTITVVDGAQAVPHMPVNVQSLGCDAYVFSGHKMLAPMGIGVVWAKKDILAKIEPARFGGGMIETVSKEKSTWAEIPYRFEAGTPNVEGIVGLGAAIDYLKQLGMEKVQDHEKTLVEHALAELTKVDGLKILGPEDPSKRTGLVSFCLQNIHPHDLSSVLDAEGVAVRSGHHCAMPLHIKMGINASTRASFYLYNDKADVDKLVKGIRKAQKILL